MNVLTEKLLENLNNFTDLGRQRAFELENACYFQISEGDWRKELPSGEIFSLEFVIKYDTQGHPLEILDLFQEQIN